MKIKKALMYFISFFSLSVMFTACYYLSYKNALKDFNESAVERNHELIMSLENNGLLQLDNYGQGDNTGSDEFDQDTVQDIGNNEDTLENSVAVDTVSEDTILPTTQYTLQIYDIKTGILEEEELPTPSYLIDLNREDVIRYLGDYMQDLPLNEFEKGLMSFELMIFSKDSVVLRKSYNEDMVEYKYYLKAQSGYIVAYYGDQKTVFDYTGVSIENLSQSEQMELEEGIYVKDLNELYALLENYSS